MFYYNNIIIIKYCNCYKEMAHTLTEANKYKIYRADVPVQVWMLAGCYGTWKSWLMSQFKGHHSEWFSVIQRRVSLLYYSNLQLVG